MSGWRVWVTTRGKDGFVYVPRWKLLFAAFKTGRGQTSVSGEGTLDGLPDDLVRILRDPSIIVPQDAAVFKLIAEAIEAPSGTMSALSACEWREAWTFSTRKWREAEANRDALAAELEAAQEALRGIKHLIAHEYRLKHHTATLVINTAEQIVDAALAGGEQT